ncbi:hypothetical protein QQF64_033797 [Cirrhinus molitorella]|uniref:C2H2-type domain-containing protein n=1 Tax=Cirrhinus molitorella TaxID=172907 RepID=A0ABR3MUX0_9TELE
MAFSGIKIPSIQRGCELPTLNKCTSCCSLYHCPFCTTTFYKPSKKSKVQAHLQLHLSRAVIHEDVATYSKCCHQCGIHYRYQEWKDGLHNFNDSIILDLPLCLHIRNMLQAHTAVGRVVQCLELTIGEQFPPAKTVLHAYLHFEALTSDEYEYSCVTCGDHPPIVIMDLHRKGAFNMSLSDIKPPPKEFNGNVNIEDFWRKLSLQMIGRGFVKSNSLASMCLFLTVVTTCGNRGLEENTRKSNQCLNTEFQKIHQPKELSFAK